MRDVLKQVIGALEGGREVVLCQVVETRGSTPQKAGALMAVDPAGGQVGTLGGGCVEAEVKQKAIRRLGRDGAELFTFVLDHDYAWADGLICGGKMLILAEGLRGPGPAAYFRALLAAWDDGRGCTEAIAVDPSRCDAARVGARFLFGPVGECLASWPEGPAPGAVAEQVEPIERRPRAGCKLGVATLPTLPRVRLVIVGAGHVGQAVAELASRADFEVWAVDDRAQYANAERFPDARRLVVGPFDEVLPAVAAEATPHTYALVVTRGHGHDQEALYHLATTPAPYVGLIGSRRKIRLILDGLRAQGVPEEALARVKAPVGLDIGSQSVFEIAVSIVAELIGRRNLGGAVAEAVACEGAGA